MIREASFLLVASLVGSASADQFSEVYNRDDSFLKFRDSSDFQPPQPELREVPIDGLPPNQQGYRLVNVQAGQRTQPLTDVQKETVRRQQEFLNSALEPNVARNQPSPPSNPFFGQQKSTFTPSSHAPRLLDSPEESFSARPTFKLRIPEDQVTPSSLHTIEFNSFQNQPALVNQGSGSVIQRVPLQKNAEPEWRPSAVQEQTTTPSYRGVNSGFSQDFLRTSNRQQQSQIVLPEVPHDRFTIRKPVPSVNEPQRSTEFRGLGSQQSARQPEPDNFQRLPSNEVFSNFRSGEEEEARFISQVNQNTAAGASQIDKFQVSPQLNNFNALPVAPARGTSRRPVNKPQHDTFDDSQVRQPVFGNRKPGVPEVDQSQFSTAPTPATPLPGISRQRPSPDSVDSNQVRQPPVFRTRTPVVPVVDQSQFNTIPTPLAPLHEALGHQPSSDSFDANQGRQPTVFRTRKPAVPVINQSQLNTIPTPVAPLSDISRQRPPSRLQGKNAAQSEEVVDELEARKQAESAQYNFASSVSDTVNGNSQSRQESRDGLKLSGMYSYSDGFFHRTVYYEADENGYRIVKEENEPIGKGPEYDPDGVIQVDYQHDGSRLNYRIRGDQLKKRPPAEKKRPVARPTGFTTDYDDQFQLPA